MAREAKEGASEKAGDTNGKSKASVEKACAITPGLESPTISPLQKEDWVAVRAMVLCNDTNRLMDELWALGARGILVTDIHACRL